MQEKRKIILEYLEELTQVIANDSENFETLSEEDEVLISKYQVTVQTFCVDQTRR